MIINIYNKIRVELRNPPTKVSDWFTAELPLMIEHNPENKADINIEFTRLIIPPTATLISSAIAVKDKHTYIKDSASSFIKMSFNDLDKDKITLQVDHSIDPLFFIQVLEPLMQFYITFKKALFIHASAVKLNQHGVVFSAWAHTGKSNLVLGMLKRGAGYLADDWTIIDEDNIYAYPKSLNLFNYNFKHYPELKKKAPKKLRALFALNSLVLKTMSPFAKGNNTIAHYAREVKQVLDAKGHVRIPLRQAFPVNQIVGETKLTDLFLIARINTEEFKYEDMPAETYAQVMSLCLEYERRDFLSWYRMSQFVNPIIVSRKLNKLANQQKILLQSIAEKHPPKIIHLPEHGQMNNTVSSIYDLITNGYEPGF
ncbi:hypothetical protein ACFL04_02125 [Patescibacteria group bacterium]